MSPPTTAAPPAETQPRPVAPRFKRKPPPFLIRCWFSVQLLYVFRPLLWFLRKTGRLEDAMAKMSRNHLRRTAENNPFRGYVPGPQDVFVATYAKSGTHWMMQIALQLIYHGRAEFDHVHEIVPWPDVEVSRMLVHRKFAIPLAEANHWQTAPERKRVIHTHFSWDLLPYSQQAHYIIVIRDPKEVFVSNYYFSREIGFGPVMPPLEDWYKNFISSDPLAEGGSWAASIAGFWAQRHRPNVLIVSFKSMKRDLRGTVQKVARFLDVKVSDEVIDDVVRQSTFSYMKSIDHKLTPRQLRPWKTPSFMLRKGNAGGSSELLTPEQQREIDAHFIAELKRLGSDFPYEEFCDLAR